MYVPLSQQFEKGWYEQLEEYFKGFEFKSSYRSLTNITRGKVIAPSYIDTFAAFKACPWDKVNTVIIADEPFNTIDRNHKIVADGLAFSSRYSADIPDQTNLFLEAINQDIYNGENNYIGIDWDLSYLAKQGVLLLNSCLTSPIGGYLLQHQIIWRPFLKKVIELLNKQKENLVVILIGYGGAAFRTYFTNGTFLILKADSPANVSEGEKWDHKQIFKKAQNYLKSKSDIVLNWA